jgi:hypothetical protein
MKKLVVPKFSSERAETKWWDAHKNTVESNLIEGMRKGTARQGTPSLLRDRIKKSRNITIRMPLADLERARLLSEKKGLGYQTYMKMLLHEALDREQETIKPASRR